MNRNTRRKMKEFESWQIKAFEQIMPLFHDAIKPIEKEISLTIKIPVPISWQPDHDADAPFCEDLYDILTNSANDGNQDAYEKAIAKEVEYIQDKINSVWKAIDEFAEEHNSELDDEDGEDEIDSDDVFDFLERNQDLYKESHDISMSSTMRE